jgi:restriction system protein
LRVTSIRKDDFYLPTLQVLRDLGGSGSIEEIEEQLIERFGFTQDELDQTYPVSGDNIITDKMSWARSYLKFPGFVSNERGIWVLTEAGRHASELEFDSLRSRIRDAKRVRREGQRKAREEKPDGLKSANDEELDEDVLEWSDLLLQRIKSISPAAFERLCQRLLRESGFTRVEVTGRSGDEGIDGQGVLRVNLVSFHVLFQCKRYKGSVGPSVIRDFRGAMQGRADKGLVITTGTFTPDARREATRDGAPAIDLIDGEALCLLLKDQRLGVGVKMVEDITVDESFFEELGD